MGGAVSKNDALWVVSKAADEKASASISASLGVTPAMGRLLYKRGCHTAEEARAFIRMEEGRLHDPFLLPDMAAAVDAIAGAIKAKKKILIYGDYDADGVTSVSVLYLYLSELGADVGYFIPTRAEGYGMSCDAVRRLAGEGVGLIVTVDTGTTASEEVALANSLGIDVVVTDHHECMDELPPAAAIVNPQRHDSSYPFCGLAGVGVAYKLVCALESRLRAGGDTARATLDVSAKYIDLVAIGTVADVMPVTDENRVIISYGLSRIGSMSRPGIAALMEASSPADAAHRAKRPRVTSGYIGFSLAPRINAAGRMGDASLAVRLFLSENMDEAASLAKELCEINLDRQRLENRIMTEACEKIESTHDFENDPVIVIADEGWHHGVIGIVASRVTEKYGRPSILISFEGGNVGKGSGRSVRGLNLATALSRCSDTLLRFGGHELAAGLTIEKDRLDDFRRELNDVARDMTGIIDATPEILVDDELDESELTLTLAEEIRLLEPYGGGNPTPLFMSTDMRIISAVGVGGDKHTRLTLRAGCGQIAAMCFSAPPRQLGLAAGDRADILYNLDVNEFRGTTSPQLIVRAARKSKAAAINGEMLYRALRSGEAEGAYGKYVPTRRDLASLYRAMAFAADSGRHIMTVSEAASLSGGLDPVKVRLSLDVFAELEILRVAVSGENITFSRAPDKGKVDLDSSALLSMLRSRYAK